MESFNFSDAVEVGNAAVALCVERALFGTGGGNKLGVGSR